MKKLMIMVAMIVLSTIAIQTVSAENLLTGGVPSGGTYVGLTSPCGIVPIVDESISEIVLNGLPSGGTYVSVTPPCDDATIVYTEYYISVNITVMYEYTGIPLLIPNDNYKMYAPGFVEITKEWKKKDYERNEIKYVYKNISFRKYENALQKLHNKLGIPDKSGFVHTWCAW